VQPGTASALLNAQGSVQLDGPQVSTISLAPTIQATIKPAPDVTPKHHVNAALFGIAALLLVTAIILALIIQRSVKNTT